jgi:hypothetical protein
MPTLVIPGAYQVAIHQVVSGQEIVNVLGVTSDGFGAANVVADKVHAAYIAAGGPISWLSNAVKIEKIKVTDLSGPTGEIYEKTTADVGKGTGQVGSLATCAVVRVTAGNRSRSGKGRVYFGPLAASNLGIDGRSLLPTTATGIATAFQQFRTAINSDGYQWVVLSRKLSVATPITNVSVASIIGTQRRRLR